jgi:hypothetical protein
MRHLKPIFLACLLVAAMLDPAPADAQSNRTFVSGQGTDSGTCGLTAPCRSFAFALSETNAGGEITVLSPAGYGAVTISKAVSIVNEGVGEAGITVTSGDAITINAGATDTVSLRGLTLVGSGTAANGIVFNSGAALNVSNSVVRGFTNSGIFAGPTGSSNFAFSDTIVSNDGSYGIYIDSKGSSTTANTVFNRVQALGNTGSGLLVSGASATGSVQATAVDCVASGNGVGFNVSSQSSHAATIFTIVNSLAGSSTTAGGGNGTGLNATGTNAMMVIRHSTVANNVSHGYAVLSGAVLDSFGDNVILDTNNSGALSTLSLK